MLWKSLPAILHFFKKVPETVFGVFAFFEKRCHSCAFMFFEFIHKCEAAAATTDWKNCGRDRPPRSAQKLKKYLPDKDIGTYKKNALRWLWAVKMYGICVHHAPLLLGQHYTARNRKVFRKVKKPIDNISPMKKYKACQTAIYILYWKGKKTILII